MGTASALSAALSFHGTDGYQASAKRDQASSDDCNEASVLAHLRILRVQPDT
jgi:hypothetical protein